MSETDAMLERIIELEAQLEALVRHINAEVPTTTRSLQEQGYTSFTSLPYLKAK